MKRIAFFGLLAAALVITPLAVQAADEAKDATITGEAVDIACFSQGRSGEGHATCAKACAERGMPIGVVTEEDGKKQLYLVLAPQGKLPKDIMAEHMGQQVKVTGKVKDQDGMKIIAVEKVEKA